MGYARDIYVWPDHRTMGYARDIYVCHDHLLRVMPVTFTFAPIIVPWAMLVIFTFGQIIVLRAMPETFTFRPIIVLWAMLVIFTFGPTIYYGLCP